MSAYPPCKGFPASLVLQFGLAVGRLLSAPRFVVSPASGLSAGHAGIHRAPKTTLGWLTGMGVIGLV
jgi:hypothetical protein